MPPELLDPVVAYFNPQKVILIGSVARGEAGPDSDIDLVVVLDDNVPPEMLSGKSVARGARKTTAAPSTLSRVELPSCRTRARARSDLLPHQILRDGIIGL